MNIDKVKGWPTLKSVGLPQDRECAEMANTLYLNAVSTCGKVAPLYAAIVLDEKVKHNRSAFKRMHHSHALAWGIGTTPESAHRNAESNRGHEQCYGLIVDAEIAQNVGSWLVCQVDGSPVIGYGSVPMFALTARSGGGGLVGTIDGLPDSITLAVSVSPMVKHRSDGLYEIALRPSCKPSETDVDKINLVDAVTFFVESNTAEVRE